MICLAPWEIQFFSGLLLVHFRIIQANQCHILSVIRIGVNDRWHFVIGQVVYCLLYTSDAADD